MSEKLGQVDNLQSYGSPATAMTMEAKSCTVLKPSKQFRDISGLKEEEIYSEVDILPTKCEQFFSTPVQSMHMHKLWSSIDLQVNPSGYKSFFSSECNEIIQQLKSKAAQGWSASKRKLEELDISTIEAEPPPLLFWTPKSVLDESTCNAKRRRIDYQGGEEHFSVLSSLTKQKSPGLGVSSAQCLVKVHKYVLNKNRSSTRKCRSHYNSTGHIKRSLFVKKSRTTHPQSSLPAKGEKSVSREWKSGPWIHKGNFQNHESPSPVLEFKSFFAVECERICKQLKRHDTKRIILGNVSSIEAELPPDLSATINSTITLELGRTCSEVSVGVGQLDLEKMNINYSKTERDVISQKVPDTALCNGNANGRKGKAMVPDTTQDSVQSYEVASSENATQKINNRVSTDGTKKEIQMIYNPHPIADVTQDISTMHVMANDAEAMQGKVKMHRKMSFSPADTPHAHVSMSNGVPCIMHDAVNGPNKLPLMNAIQDIITRDVSVARCTQVIVTVGDGSAWNSILDNLTCSKAHVTEDPTGAGSNYSIANGTKGIGETCNVLPSVQATQTIRTTCRNDSAADATLEAMDMINEVCATADAQEMGRKRSEAAETADTRIIRGTRIDPENKTTNILQACCQIPTQRNMVTVDSPLQNVTLVKTDANVVHCLQNIVSVHPEMTPDCGMYKTFTHCKVADPHVAHNISVNWGIVRAGVQDRTLLISHKGAPNIPPDISVIDGKPKINSTHTLISICNEVTGIDPSDLTKVIATNCTVFDMSKNVYNQVDQPDKQSRLMWPITALAQSSPVGNMRNLKDLTYNLEQTISHDEKVFYNRPIPFTTSTPLPSLGNHTFFKSCGLPAKPKPNMFSILQHNNNVTLEQTAIIPQLSGQSLAGEARIGEEMSQDAQYPKVLKRATPKVMASRLPQPFPRSALPRSDWKMPQQVTSAVVLQKDPGTLGRTHMKPLVVPTELPRKTIQHGQPCKSGASSSILIQQTPVNSVRAGKDFFKTGIDVSKFPTSALVRPPSGLSTQMFAGKVQSVPGPQRAARSCKASSVNPSSGSDPSSSVHKEPRKPIQHGQPCTSGVSSSILQQPTPEDCTRAGKDFFKKGIDVSPIPSSSLLRPPSGLSMQIFAGKVQSVPGPQRVARSRQVSSVNPSSGSDPSCSVQKEPTFIRPSNLVDLQIHSKIKHRASGVPVRRSQEALLQPKTK